MARLKNIGPEVHVYSPGGFPSSILVDTDQIVEVPGEITDEVVDAYIVGENGAARAWPKAQWQTTSTASHDNQNEES